MKILKITMLLLLATGFAKAQQKEIMKLPTNANDTLVMWVMYTTGDGVGEGRARKVYLGKEYTYSETQLKAKTGTSVAKFPGGQEVLDNYFSNNFKYYSGMYGKTDLSAIVGYNGKLSDIKIQRLSIDTRDSDEEVTKELIKTLRNGPRWIPAVLDGKRVKSEIWILLRPNPNYVSH